MMQVSKDFYIKCNKCGSLVQIDTNSLEYETSTYERPMGEEIEYNFYGEICCERCHTWISFNIRGNEYPVGAYNYSDFNCCGGVFVDKPTVEIKYELDDYYVDYAYGEVVEAEYRLACNREKIKRMSPEEFERFVAGVFQNMGYSVKITKKTRDGGRDIIATKGKPIPFTLLIECKHWDESRKVDVSVVRELYGVQSSEQANKSIIVTTTRFTKDARKFAEKQSNMMTLWDMDDLLKLIGENDIGVK